MAKYFAVIATLFAVTNAQADCGHLFRRQNVVVQQFVVQPYFVPQAYYAAGEDIRLEAAIERVLRLREQQLQYNSKSPQQAPYSAPQQAPQQAPAQQQQQAPSGKQQQLQPVQSFQAFSKCARCHTGPEPKGGLTLNGQAPISAEAFRRWGQIAGQNINVPEAMKNLVNGLTPEEKGAIADAMLNAPLAVTVPPPPATDTGDLQ